MQFLRIAALSLFVLACLSVPTGQSAQPGKKSPIPSKQERATADSLIDELYRDELKLAAKDAVASANLAKIFLDEARNTNDYPAGRYMLLEKAVLLALAAGDANTALEAIDDMALHFTLSPRGVFDKKIEALLTASEMPATPPAYQIMVDAALQYIDLAVEDDDFASLPKLFTAAENAARRLRSVPHLSLVRKKQAEAMDVEKKYQRWKPFADRLSKNPNDEQANLALGVYQALLKGNWQKGLPLLARTSTDFQLKKAADLELSNPSTAQKQTELAELWLILGVENPVPKIISDKEFKDSARIQMLLRSSHWYFDALNYLTGKERDEVEQRLQKITAMLPPEYAVGEVAKELWWWNPDSGPIYCADFSPDSKRIISAGADGVLRLWDARTPKLLKQIDTRSGRIWSVCFTADNRHVLTAGFDGTVRLWNLTAGREIRRYSGHTDYVRSVAAARTGNLVLSGGDDRQIRMWDQLTGTEILSIAGHDHYVWSVALSRDGKQALSASLDKTIKLWEVETGKQLRELRGHKDTVLSVTFTPNGRFALSGSTDKTLILWNLETGTHVVFPEKHTGYVHSVAVSPDGRRALSGSADRTVRLWDLQAGKELRVLEGPKNQTRRRRAREVVSHLDKVWHVAFSPDGRLALSCGEDGVLRVWSGSKYR